MINLNLTRKYFQRLYTIGEMSINNVYFCDTLELPLEVGGLYNVHDLCCIPPGTYQVLWENTTKHPMGVPVLQGVPGRDAIEIHSGSFPHDTDGCILLGFNKIPGMVINSQITVAKFYEILHTDPDVQIMIV